MGDMEKKEGPRMYEKFRRRCHLPVSFYLIAHVATESHMGVGGMFLREGLELKIGGSILMEKGRKGVGGISNLCHNRLNFLDLYEENLVTMVIRSLLLLNINQTYKVRS